MQKKLQHRKESGFTIVEVLIVLAIAGLIILVVLLAVPALQRNARNTAIKNDASAVAGGISEYESNNDGIVPNSITAAAGVVTISGTGTNTSAKVQGGTVVNSAGNTTPPLGTISARIGFRCDGAASGRAIAVWYSTENSSATPQYKCVDS
ncbi:type II secretion system protein [Candidatus Saccharibacteria bacterium]|nr:MAG: type II secretion system protein [Candidatus Saccharibacteria bacterium]